MVSDPNNQADNTTAAPAADAGVAMAGFASAAADSVAAGESVAETADNKSWARQLKDSCDKLWTKMGERLNARKSLATGDEGSDLYKKLWWRKGLGDQVYDCGDCLHLSGTKEKPVTDQQIARMVQAAISRKDPPWETIYMWNHKGKPDPAMGQRVQNVIDAMRQQGMIPAECRIHAVTSLAGYPCDNIKGFNKYLKSLFAQAAQNGAQANPEARAGIHAHQRAGLHAV